MSVEFQGHLTTTFRYGESYISVHNGSYNLENWFCLQGSWYSKQSACAHIFNIKISLEMLTKMCQNLCHQTNPSYFRTFWSIARDLLNFFIEAMSSSQFFEYYGSYKPNNFLLVIRGLCEPKYEIPPISCGWLWNFTDMFSIPFTIKITIRHIKK